MKIYDNWRVRVLGIYNANGDRMAKITEGCQVHYEYLEELIGNPTGSMARMSRSGINATGSKAVYIRSELNNLHKYEPENIYDTAGWQGSSFVYPNGQVVSPTGVEPGYPIFQPQTERLRSSGILEGWFTEVAEPLAGQLVAEFFLGAMFAGTLRAFGENTLNPGFAIVGEREDGKSALTSLMGSVCGSPSSSADGEGYALSFSATGNGIEWEMQNYSDLTMIFDEASLFGFGLSEVRRGRELIDVSMRLAEGREKNRYKSVSRRFRYCYVTTSNDELTALIAKSASPEVVDAVASRFLSVPLKGRQHGIFDFLPPPYTDKADLIGALLSAANRHHGVAMPHFLAGLVDLVAKDPAAFRANLDERMAEFRTVALASNPRKASRRVLDSFGLVYSAMRLAQHLGALPGSFSPLAAALACYNLHVESALTAPRPMEMVKFLLNDPEVLVIDRQNLKPISKEAFRRVKAFRKDLANGDVELMMTAEAADALFGKWIQVSKGDLDLAKLVQREGDRPRVYCNVRANRRDRMACIRIPSTSPLFNGKQP